MASRGSQVQILSATPKNSRADYGRLLNEVHEWIRVVREIRMLRGNVNCAKYHIRPSSQGSWGCPKVCLAQDYGKFSDKD